MHEQIDFLSPAPRFPRARRDDPVSSHRAAAQVERTGSADAQRVLALNAVKTWPGRTSHELAHQMRMDRYAMARRLPELKRDNLARREDPTPETRPCAITSKRVCRWWPL